MLKKYALYPIFMVSLLAALILCGQRLVLEKKNKNVVLAVDGDGIYGLALQQGKTLEQSLADFQAAGISALGVTEDTLSSLRRRGQIDIVYGHQLDPTFSSPRCTYIVSQDDKLVRRLLPFLAKAVGPERLKTFADARNRVIRLTAVDPDLEENTGLGFSPEIISQARRAGLGIVLRPRSAEALAEITDWTGIMAVVFAGKTVSGYPQDMSVTAAAVERMPARLGVIEFTYQSGLDQLISGPGVLGKIVRVHSISEKEIKDIEDEKHKTTLPALAGRWALAVKERNVRLLYLQLFTKTFNGEISPVYDLNLRYIGRIAGNLKADGFNADGFSDWPFIKLEKAQVLILGLGLLAALLLLLGQAFSCSGKILGYLLAGGVAGEALLLWLAPAVSVAPLLALAASIIFPLWSLLKIQEKIEENLGPNYLKTAQYFSYAVLLNLAGAAFIAALLYGQYFWLKIGAFQGTKLALVLPLVLWFGYSLANDKNRRWEKFWEQPISHKQLLILSLVAGGMVIYLWRSGNNGNMLVTTGEEKLRSWLDQVLLARPRTKEIFFGHPLLMLGIYLGLKKKNNILIWLGGLIGQVSLINTFSHLHTPLSVSLLRVFNGWWLGIIIGWALIWFYQKYIRTDTKGEQLCLKF